MTRSITKTFRRVVLLAAMVILGHLVGVVCLPVICQGEKNVDGSELPDSATSHGTSNAQGASDEEELKTIELGDIEAHKRHRRQAIANCVAILEAKAEQWPTRQFDREYRESLWPPILLVDMYRAEEAVPALTRLLTYAVITVDLGQSTYYNFPAAVALVEIGKPAVTPMWRIIYDERSSKVEVDIACWVLIEHYQYVQGDASHSEARTYLIDRIAQRLRASEQPVPENVLHALNFILTYEETYEHPYERYPELKPPDTDGEPAPPPTDPGFFRHSDGDSDL